MRAQSYLIMVMYMLVSFQGKDSARNVFEHPLADTVTETLLSYVLDGCTEE